ncbi:MAG: carbohydrate binding family 9 domain-containing protein, partial [Acidobacteria bacterium]|nr:carbohydrate binding family 9 domain-containing protein [Acidobacteriota bacterium]
MLLPPIGRAQSRQVASLGDKSKVKTAATTSNAPALAESRTRRIAALRTRETAEGARVTVTSDAELNNYSAYEQGGRFFVRIPQADAGDAPARLAASLQGRGFEGAQIEQRGADVLLSFKLEAGATAEVRQSFNRLEVRFAAPQGEQKKTNSSGGAKDANPAQEVPSPTPSPAPNPPSGALVPAASTTTSDSSSTTATIDRAKVAAGGRGRSIALPPEKAGPIVVPRLDTPPVIDGKLDDAIWKQATVLKDFYQIEPGDNIAPSKPTEVLVGYDAKFLYFAFHAYDEPDKVRATIAKRDDVGNDDTVGMLLDTFNDQRKAYQFEFNPLGIQSDALYSEGNGDDSSFDLVMESKGMLTADGYTVEVAVPFKSLRYEAGNGKLWGAHFFRVIKRFNGETSSWMPISRDIQGNLIQAGKITGLDGISTERTLEVIPSFTVSETGKRVRTFLPTPFPNTGNIEPQLGPGRLQNKPIEFDFGVTTKFGLTPTVTLDFALNPDFAQVEADQTVVTANQRFPIFFQEKRPFFLEGKEIFDTQSTVVHTRAIVDPDYA